MNCERELTFTKKLLDNFLVPMALLRRGAEDPLTAPAMELRRLLQPAVDRFPFFETLAPLARPGVIYRHRDELDCNLLYFQVQGGDDPVIASVGPYLLQPVTQELLRENAAKFPDPARILPSLEKYYREIPCLPNENQLLVVLYTLGDYLWGGGITLEALPSSLLSLGLDAKELKHTAHSDSPLSMEALENRYADEEKLMRAVSAGQADQAAIIYSRFTSRQMERRTSPPLRDMKNYFVVFNTLLRKATEYGHVHPLYIDQTSSALAKEIEAAQSPESLSTLGPKMVRHYCRLVQDFSQKGHSHLISKLLILVEADLTADLSLSSLARQLSVNPSYLSALFKKEVGTTLTEYVSRRRVNHAMLLLEATSLQIQTIAQQCGIPDVNYFTRTFKKYAGVTPKEYRAAQRTG